MPLAERCEAKSVEHGRRQSICGALLVALVVLTFCLDFAHGIMLGQDRIGFHPIYRFRQALAIAISRMHEPPLHGYLAYQSVVDVFNENGFAIFDNEKGRHLDRDGWTALLNDTARLDHTIRAAHDVAVDPTLPPQLVLGNELAYADYVYLGFRLFGLRISSQYYLYFLLLGISCALFIAQFRASHFLMFLLTSYLAGLFFLQNYAQSWGNEVATLANSRLFEALSLLPAIHLFLLVWMRAPPTLAVVAGGLLQSALLAFIVDCRITGRWQVAMIVAAGFGLFIAGIWKRRSLRSAGRREAWNGVWAACLAVAAIGLHMAFITFDADRRYGAEPRYHIVWHEVLRGLLSTSVELQHEYLGRPLSGAIQDTDAYDAVMYDLNRRKDRSSPISRMQDGKIVIDVSGGWYEYEQMARGLAVEIAIEHPGEVLMGFGSKWAMQAMAYTPRNAMVPGNLIIAALITAVGGILWLSSGGLMTSARALASGAGAGVIVLGFAAVPPLVVPSHLSVGTLLSYLIALAVLLAVLIALLATAALKLYARASGASEARV